MNKKRIGWRREDDIQKKLEKDGWSCAKSPNSLGGYDVVAKKDFTLPLTLGGYWYNNKLPEVKISVILLIQAKSKAEDVALYDRMYLMESAYSYSSTQLPNTCVVALTVGRKEQNNKMRMIMTQLSYLNYPITAVKEYMNDYRERKKKKNE